MSEEMKNHAENKLSDEQLDQVSGGVSRVARNPIDDLKEQAEKNVNVDGKLYKNKRMIIKA